MYSVLAHFPFSGICTRLRNNWYHNQSYQTFTIQFANLLSSFLVNIVPSSTISLSSSSSCMSTFIFRTRTLFHNLKKEENCRFSKSKNKKKEKLFFLKAIIQKPCPKTNQHSMCMHKFIRSYHTLCSFDFPLLKKQ